MQPHHQETRYYYHTTTNPSLIDQVGTEAAKGLASGLGSVIERLDPGSAPGVQATLFGINRGLDADLVARSMRTTLAPSVVDVSDSPYYIYESQGASHYDDYDW